MNSNTNVEKNDAETLPKYKKNIRRVKLHFNIDKKKMDEMISKIDKRIQELTDMQEK